MSDRLQEIRERESKATRCVYDGEARWIVGDSWAARKGEPSVMTANGHPVALVGEGEDAKADAEFIAHARADIPYLIELVENYEAYVLRVERERDEARSALASARNLLATAQGERDGARSEVERLRTVIDMWVESAKRLEGQRVEATAIVNEVRKLRDGYVKSRVSLVNDTLGAVVFDLDNVLAGHKVPEGDGLWEIGRG